MTIGALVIGARQGIVYLRRANTPTSGRTWKPCSSRRREQNLLGENIARQRGLRFRHRNPHGRRGLRLRRGDRADRIAGRASRRAPQPPAVPHRHRLPRPTRRSSTTSRPSPGSCASWPRGRVVQEHRHGQVDRLQAVQRLRRLPRGRASTSSPWGSPWPSCSRKWAARGPRRCRSAGPRASASPPRNSTARSPSRTSPPAARSSSSARSATCSTWPRTSSSSSSTSRAASAPLAAKAAPSCWKASRCSQHGQCSMTYLRELCSLGETMQLAAKCGLGQSAPNAFLSIVDTFPGRNPGRPAHVEPEHRIGHVNGYHADDIPSHLRRPKPALRTVEAHRLRQGDRQGGDAHHRRQPDQGAAGHHDPRGGPEAGHPHPHPLLPRGPLPGRRVPDVRGRGRRAADAAGGLQLPDHRADPGEHPHGRGAPRPAAHPRPAAVQPLRRVLRLRAEQQLRAAGAGQGIRRGFLPLRPPGQAALRDRRAPATPWSAT